MTYARPEVTVLGNASSVIESVQSSKQSDSNDSNFPTPNINPAYDLDE